MDGRLRSFKAIKANELFMFTQLELGIYQNTIWK